ncbi:MAG: ankyrin repeat domain-containing protein [Planctomycetota bacterium]|nr:ankyrin repeat domain-containing protein [Planctomycetota bacterium]
MNTKRWLACAMVGAMALGGCGSKEKDKDKGRSASPTTPSGLEGSTPPPGAGVNAPDAMGFTQLHDAAARRKGIEDLIRRGADVNAKDKEIGWTALHWAAADGDVEMISKLLAARADVDATNLAGRTPLHEACLSGQREAVEALLAARANPKLADSNGRTPLHCAVQANNRAIVELLLARRVDVNAAAKNGQTPLQIALVSGQGEIADLLRSHGAAPVKLPDRENPLPTPPPTTKPS